MLQSERGWSCLHHLHQSRADDPTHTEVTQRLKPYNPRKKKLHDQILKGYNLTTLIYLFLLEYTVNPENVIQDLIEQN